MLPTPTACEGKTGDTEVEHSRNSPGLGAVTFHFPTPKAHDGEFGMPRTSGRPIEKSTHLQTIVSHHFPTPTASDATGGGQHPSMRVGHTQQLIDTVLGLSGAPTDPLFDVGSD